MTDNNAKRFYWFTHQGVSILMMDFSHATAAESLSLMDSFGPSMDAQPADSVLMLTDVTEAAYDPAISNKWKAIRLKHDDKIHASAIFGLSGLVGVAIRSFLDLRELLNLSGSRKLRIFKTRDQALAWLVKA